MRVASVASTFRTPSRSSDRSSAGAGAAGQALSPLPADSPVSTPGSVIDPEFDTRSRHASAGSVGSGVTVASQASVSGISGTSTSLVSLKRPMPGRPLGGGGKRMKGQSSILAYIPAEPVLQMTPAEKRAFYDCASEFIFGGKNPIAKAVSKYFLKAIVFGYMMAFRLVNQCLNRLNVNL